MSIIFHEVYIYRPDISTLYVNYGSTVMYTYAGLLFACPLLTINWNVNVVGHGTIGAMNIGLAVL
ncbi:MAG TPA: hypothetical protein VFI73_14835 [Candidatus Nitrosopolaris sp.]|nr:hypothetical protein [Candidatus Nitrosopolaris sp.]